MDEAKPQFGSQHPTVRTKKSLGQHFLRDRTVPPRIANGAGIEASDLIVEVGPGLGVLTVELAGRLEPEKGGRLVAVELDGTLLPLLHERFVQYPHVSFRHADILDVPPGELTGGRPYKLIANLPYYITSAVLRHFLEAEAKPLSLTVMVQREVADRIVARPPEMSLMSVAVQFYGVPKILFRVPPGAFNPPPKVESAVIRVDIFREGEAPVQPTSESDFFRIAQAGFGQRRKQLANTLSSGIGLSKSEVVQHLHEAGIDPARRPETLTLKEWGEIERVLRSSISSPLTVHAV